MRSIAIFFLLLFAGLFSVNVIAQQPGSSTPILEKQRIKYKVYLSMLADDRQLESIRIRDVILYSTHDSSLVITERHGWFYPNVTPTEIIPVEKIWEVRARKREQVAKGILIGMGATFVLGGALSWATYKPCSSGGWECFVFPSRKGATVFGAFASGVIFGIPIGAAAGSTMKRIPIKGNRSTYAAQREKLKRLSITGQ